MKKENIQNDKLLLRLPFTLTYAIDLAVKNKLPGMTRSEFIRRAARFTLDNIDQYKNSNAAVVHETGFTLPSAGFGCRVGNIWKPMKPRRHYRGGIARRILKALKKLDGPVRAGTLAETLKASTPTIAAQLCTMAKHGEIRRVGHGLYQSVNPLAQTKNEIISAVCGSGRVHIEVNEEYFPEPDGWE